MIDIKSKEQFDTILQSKNVIVDLYAEWCGPCKRLTKPLEELEQKYDHISFCKLNIDLMEEMGIELEMPETIPCILYYKDSIKIEKLNTSDIRTIETNFILF